MASSPTFGVVRGASLHVSCWGLSVLQQSALNLVLCMIWLHGCADMEHIPPAFEVCLHRFLYLSCQ